MQILTAAAAALLALAGCSDAAHKPAIDALEYAYITALQDAPGSKKCLTPKQLDGRWFTLCGINTGGPQLGYAGLWELRTDGSTWAAYAANGKAMAVQGKLTNPQLKPAEAPLTYDTAKARALFD